MVAARLIEIDRQGVYRFSSEDRRALVAAYVQSVKESGVSCYANACANRNLIRYVTAAARDLQAVPPSDLEAYEAAFRKAARTSRRPAAQTKAAARPWKPKSYQLTDLFKGFRVFEMPLSSLRFPAPKTATGWVVLLLPVPVGLLIGLLRRRFGTLASFIDLGIRNLPSEENV
jgi:cobaltochelatase CobN